MADKALALAIGGAALYQLSKKKPGLPPPGSDTPVTLGAEIVGVGVSQPVQMGNHRITKAFGSPVLVDVQWTPNTRDNLGNAVEWPYLIVARLGHNTLFGWRQVGDGISGLFGDGHAEIRVNGIGSTTTTKFAFTAPPDEDQEWDVRVWVFALPDANGDGIPEGDPDRPIGVDRPLDQSPGTTEGWQFLASADHPTAIVTTNGDAVSPAVSSLSVSVSQDPAAMAQVSKSPGSSSGLTATFGYRGAGQNLLLVARLRAPSGTLFTAGSTSFNVAPSLVTTTQQISHVFSFPSVSQEGLYDLLVDLNLNSSPIASATVPSAYSVVASGASVSGFGVTASQVLRRRGAVGARL